MNLSMRWLQDYVDTTGIAPREYAEAMSISGSKVETYEYEGEGIEKVVVGRLMSVTPHPDSDHLLICQVDVGTGKDVQIVTGAQNVAAGQLVPAALDGAKLPDGKEIHATVFRGVESDGMLCSLGELGLTTHDFPDAIEDGIMVITDPCTPGEDIREALGLNDLKVEFEITPNRPDCLSIRGLARETAVTFDRKLTLPDPVVKGSGGDAGELLKVRIDAPDLCYRYIGRVVKNVKIEPSPRWMRERLRACGVRPINNIVDITNYVMLEYGQPMHAFDLRYVKGAQIIVRRARAGETITTLDDQLRQLTPEMLVIADTESPVAVAGVMGGEFSGIMDDTNTIVFESACFNGPSVRATARKLGMRTEASGRYEKGLDPAITYDAVQRACELVELLGAGEVVDGMVDCDCSHKPPRQIPLDAGWISDFLGIEIPEATMVEILRKLGFTVENGIVTVPSFRGDVEGKADLAEEVARIYGYDKIPTTTPRPSTHGRYSDRQLFEQALNRVMVAEGCYEIATYSFYGPRDLDRIRMAADDPRRQAVTISNPLGEDTSIMRTSTLPSMLGVLQKNFAARNLAARLYEIGNEYLYTGPDTLPDERATLTIGLYGEGEDFYALSGILSRIGQVLHIPGIAFRANTAHPTFHPGRCADILLGDRVIGVAGEVHPLVQANYGLRSRVYLAKVDFAALFEAHTEPHYTPLPRFPAVTRDLALVCDDTLPVGTLESTLRQSMGALLESVQLFDVYKGAQLPEGKKSVAYALLLRAADHTLGEDEIQAVMAKGLAALEAIGVTIRS